MKRYNILLRQAREERSWSQKEVAEKIGALPNTVSRWERGEVYPTTYFRQKLMALFPELNPFPLPLPVEPAEHTETPSDWSSHEHTNTRRKHAHEAFQDSNHHDDPTQHSLLLTSQPLEKEQQRVPDVSFQSPRFDQSTSS